MGDSPRASPTAKAPGVLRPSSSRTQGGRRGERTSVRDPKATDRGRRNAPVSELLVDPGHHAPEVFADALDFVALEVLAHAVEVLAAGVVLGDPLAGELAGL